MHLMPCPVHPLGSSLHLILHQTHLQRLRSLFHPLVRERRSPTMSAGKALAARRTLRWRRRKTQSRLLIRSAMRSTTSQRMVTVWQRSRSRAPGQTHQWPCRAKWATHSLAMRCAPAMARCRAFPQVGARAARPCARGSRAPRLTPTIGWALALQWMHRSCVPCLSLRASLTKMRLCSATSSRSYAPTL